MSAEFDFNIENYTIDELKKFIGLKNDDDYTYDKVVKNHENMINIITINSDDKHRKQQLIVFANEVKKRLVQNVAFEKSEQIFVPPRGFAPPFHPLLEKVDFPKGVVEQNDSFIEKYDKLLVGSTEKNVINKTSTTYAGHTYVMNKETTSFNDVLNKNEYLNPVETFPTNVSRGILNNLKRKTITQTIILNSLYREDYLTTPST